MGGKLVVPLMGMGHADPPISCDPFVPIGALVVISLTLLRIRSLATDAGLSATVLKNECFSPGICIIPSVSCRYPKLPGTAYI